jgi:hypothetical protein
LTFQGVSLIGDRIPIHLCPDPFMMNENAVNLGFFNEKNIEIKSFAINREPGYDVLAAITYVRR